MKIQLLTASVAFLLTTWSCDRKDLGEPEVQEPLQFHDLGINGRTFYFPYTESYDTCDMYLAVRRTCVAEICFDCDSPLGRILLTEEYIPILAEIRIDSMNQDTLIYSERFPEFSFKYVNENALILQSPLTIKSIYPLIKKDSVLRNTRWTTERGCCH